MSNITESRIIEKDELLRLLAYWRFKSQKIVFTNGCFDILHHGHIDYLSKAKSLGDILIVGLNTDSSVRRIKGKNRPLNSETARAAMLAALRFVDAVVLFNEDTPEELIKTVLPDILVKGSDYKKDDIIGHDLVTKNGGEVLTIELVPEISTTAIIEKLSSL